jgi:hypothetical protein
MKRTSPTRGGSPSLASSARAAGLLLATLVCACNFGGADEDAGTLDIDFDANVAFDAPSYAHDAGNAAPHDAGAHGDAGTEPAEDAAPSPTDAANAAPDAPGAEAPGAEAGADATEVADASVLDATVEAGPSPVDATADAAAHDATVTNLDAAGSADVAADVGTVTLPPAVTLTLAGFPTPATAGAAGSFTVTALNAASEAATGYRGTVRCTSSDPQATLPANYTFTAGDDGAHALTAVFATAGTQTLTCTDTTNTGLSGSETVTVVAGAAANVAVDGGNAQAGLVGTALPNPLVVLVTDAYGNAVSNAQVTWTAAAGGGLLAGGAATVMSSTGADGVATVLVTLGATPGSDAFEASIAGAQNAASFAETALADVTIAPNPVTTVVGHSVAFAASGGTGTGYVFALSPTSTSTINPATGVYVAGSTPGTDTVLVTDSAGYAGSAQVIINPHVAFSVTSLAVQPRGTATLGATGGIAPYTFAFASNGNRSGGTLTGGAYAAGAPDESAEPAFLGELVDNALVTDSTGDTATLAIKVTAGPVIAPWGMQLSTADSFCFGTLLGRTSSGFHASGGSGTGYTFSLATNASGGTINATDGCYTPGTNGANAVHVTDAIQVTDSLGNVYGRTLVDVVNTTGTRMIPSIAAISVDGGFRIAGTGGTGPYDFTAATNESGGQVSTGTIGILSTGTSWVAGANGGSTTTEIDTITVTDTGCPPTTFCLSGDGTAVVTPGPALSPSAVSVYPGDPITFIASGGTFSGYAYAIGTNNSGATIDATAGTYIAGATSAVSDSVTVTDGNAAASSPASIRVLARPAGLSISPAAATIPPGGAALFRGAAGTPPYRFTVNTADAIDATSGYFRASVTRGAAVTVTVTDALNRTATASVTVGAALVARSSSASISSGETAQLTATGGAASDHEWFVTTNNSGGFVGRNTGIYQGGCAQGSGTVTDTVEVTDLLGNTATTTLSVNCPIIE